MRLPFYKIKSMFNSKIKIKMKKCLILMTALIMSLSTVNAKDKYHLIVEGEFLFEKNVQCDLYEIKKDSTVVKVETVKNRKYYSLKVDVGYKYIVKFTSKSGQIKELYLDVTKDGYFAVNVDFKRREHGALVYDISHRMYRIRLLPKEEVTYYVKN